MVEDAFESNHGSGGETHQHIPEKGPHERLDHLTTNQGIRVSDNQNSLKSGVRGPTLLEDFLQREKIFHFDNGFLAAAAKRYWDRGSNLRLLA